MSNWDIVGKVATISCSVTICASIRMGMILQRRMFQQKLLWGFPDSQDSSDDVLFQLFILKICFALAIFLCKIY